MIQDTTAIHTSTLSNSEIPLAAGIGLRACHYRNFQNGKPPTAWVEAHSENLFAAGGLAHRVMHQVRNHYPVSLHGVGLSLGSADPLNKEHLQQLQQVISRYEPGLVSEHLCWVSSEGRYLHDLLPIPYTEGMLQHVSDRIDQVQNVLQRQILIENVSAYLHFADDQMAEWAFLNALVGRTGCGLLLDINNLYVNSRNLGINSDEYLANLKADAVQEIHLAGFSIETALGQKVFIDTHSQAVWPEVWTLYRRALQIIGRPIPTLIEWDTNIPPLAILLEEAQKAQHILEGIHA
ncbi:hypothetical protein A6M27_02200 [Acidithiobacillus thiooxidans]|jgi:uncharacterized protein (UPF0276 family)|uniref:Uncharacterized protein n=1 Tax=Acidithiobacillus thiooxidans TaxID=930 RepID=A0A1C2IF30_ACITH|nr:DUF692 domain-containing protein [Acidithiobacillus thiooxidans]OCX74589.1 hypothetical protein A6P07_05340 [Acidithiobacillus thiooxidans]OCX75507.1 hypothetical protein A6O24_09845 [Acidithiobacillus thiooxidans]OCX82828.1 hypothetical protein A6O26_08675 [Acidithiobacillus thiooxidans]OCX89401.1 hypothetical protein A6M27_02200 [Acidithiobacillus thiooxidans]OFC49164.1 hypothetical protein BAE47_05745 [Acidithiobacillus thiooxidans]